MPVIKNEVNRKNHKYMGKFYDSANVCSNYTAVQNCIKEYLSQRRSKTK